MLGCRWAARFCFFGFLFFLGGLSRSSFLVRPLFVLVGSVGIVSFTLCLPPPPTSPCANPVGLWAASSGAAAYLEQCVLRLAHAHFEQSPFLGPH